MVHRDLKPQNILLAPEEKDDDSPINVKITDFGFSCFYNPKIGLSQACGTLYY